MNFSLKNKKQSRRHSQNGLHSVNDEYSFIGTVGQRYWYKNGYIHRDDDKPAYVWESAGDLRHGWFREGFRHRTCGPVIIDTRYEEIVWYINGYYVTDEIVEWASTVGIDPTKMVSEDDEALIIMVFAELLHEN